MPDTRPKLLIVEDDSGLQRQLRWSYDEYQLFIAGDRIEAVEILRAQKPPVVTLDLGLPPDPDGVSEGFATLEEMLRIAPSTKIIVASGHGERESARRSIAQGAWDFYQKPIDLDSLRHIVGRAFHVHQLEQENARLCGQAPADHKVLPGILTAAPEMMAVARIAERAAGEDVCVLLLGAAGTGKATIARALHAGSRRAGRPMTITSGAELTEERLADCLAQAGPPDQATLYIQDIADLAPMVQLRLMQWLDRGLDRGSETGSRPRIIATSQIEIAPLVASGQLREDFYYRVAELVIPVPSLAERTGDAVLLARHFLKGHAAQLNPTVTGLAPDALAAIDAWTWPGNVRELENRIKRAVLLGRSKMLSAGDLDLQEPMADADNAIINLKAAREEADRQAIRHAIARSEGNVSKAARLLGVSRPTLYDMMKSYGISA